MDLTNKVQILDKDVNILIQVNPFGKTMNLSLHHPDYG